MSLLKYWNGSSWVLVPDGTAVKYWSGSAWTNPSFVKYWNGSSWVTAWSKSDPVTYHYYPAYTVNVRAGSTPPVGVYDSGGSAADNAQADLYIGAFAGSFPYHYQSYMSFGASVEGPTIGAALAVRPNVTSASLRLTRTGASGSSPATGTLYTGLWTQSGFNSLPSTSVGTSPEYHDFVGGTSASITGLTYNGETSVSVSQTQVDALGAGTKALMLAGINTSSFTSSVGSTTGNYMAFLGNENGAAGTRPYLSITFDY